MKQNFLHERLEELGWTPYRLAQELDKLRGEGKGALNYTSTVKRALDNPELTRTKTLEDLIKIMDGELIVRWRKKEPVVVAHEDVSLSE